MNHRERIHAALRGAPSPSSGLDHTPVTLWRHFPNDDQSAEKLAARVVEFQRKFDFDFVKVTPAGGYPAEMYGARLRTPDTGSVKFREGSRDYITRPVNALADWDKITPLDATNPVFARELTALRLIRPQLGGDVHILQTIFSPLNTALNLAGDRLYADLRAQPDVLHRALRALTQTTVRFAVASLRAGADAIFFATQMATSARLTLDEYRAFGEPYDVQALEALRAAKADFIFLHIHGLDIFFDELARYPVDIINWHDRRTAPSLKEARTSTALRSAQRALAGGINEWDTLAAKPRDDVIAEARDAIAQTDGRGFILAAGCVIPTDTPEENVRAVLEAARG
jgi:uroporphyrinogen decarboxylase